MFLSAMGEVAHDALENLRAFFIGTNPLLAFHTFRRYALGRNISAEASLRIKKVRRRPMKCVRFTQLVALALLANLLLVSKSQALLAISHITDGIVSPGEWNNPGVTFVDFPQSEAGLYAQEVSGPSSATLYLLYDYYGHPASAVGGSSFRPRCTGAGFGMIIPTSSRIRRCARQPDFDQFGWRRPA